MRGMPTSVTVTLAFPSDSLNSIPRSFRLFDTQLNTTGAVLHVYERLGGLKYGEVEVGQEPVIFASEAIHR
jgi:hypothetical protein